MTFCLVLPASVTIVCGDTRSATAAKSDGELRHRRCQQHDIGVGELGGPVGIDGHRTVDDPARSRELEVGAAASDADDGVHASRGLQRQRERAADETDADDDELADAGSVFGHGRPGISGEAPRTARPGSAGSRRASRR